MSEPNVARLVGAMRRQRVDRVPNYEVLIGRCNVSELLGRPAPSSLALEPREQIELVQRTGMDCVLVLMPRWRLRNPLAPANGRAHEGDIQTWEDLKRAQPFSYEEHVRPAVEHTEKHLEAVQRTSIGVGALAGHEILSSTIYAMGFERFMLDMVDDPAFVAAVLEANTSYEAALIEEAVKLGVDWIGVGDDVAHKSGTFLPLETMAKLWLPRWKCILGPAITAGIPVYFHCDGQLSELLPMLIEMGISAVHPVEPYSNDIYALKRQYGDRIAFMGNIDIAGPLAFGTPDEVEADVRQHLEGLMDGGGYILSSSHSIIDDIPPANYRRMIETTHREGKY